MTDFTKSACPAITLAAALAIATIAFPAAPARADDLTLVETGSTLLFPLFKVWAVEYTKTHPGIHITTNATGSGAGIDQAVSGAVQIGTSDAYMSDAQARKSPQIINVPMAISALTVNYNLPGLNGTQSEVRWSDASGHLYRKDPQLGRQVDRGAQSGREAAAQRHHSGPSQRRIGRYLRLHPISDILDPVLGRQTRLWHHDRVACGSGRLDRGG
jgi:hypothetical protein